MHSTVVLPADPTPTPRAPAAKAIGAVMSLRPEAAMTGMSTAREMAWAAASVGAARSIAPWMPPLFRIKDSARYRASVNTHFPQISYVRALVWTNTAISTQNRASALLALVLVIFSNSLTSLKSSQLIGFLGARVVVGWYHEGTLGKCQRRLCVGSYVRKPRVHGPFPLSLYTN